MRLVPFGGSRRKSILLGGYYSAYHIWHSVQNYLIICLHHDFWFLVRQEGRDFMSCLWGGLTDDEDSVEQCEMYFKELVHMVVRLASLKSAG